jgi:nucleoside-diphosphate-sugar epimerase
VGVEETAMKVLVTGGGGFLGGRIAQLLWERGDSVLVFGRNRYPRHEQTGVPTMQGDVRDPQAVRQACMGMEAVIHTAALAGLGGKRRDFWSINVEGTRHVIDACRAAGVPKLVYTSSPSVVCGAEDLNGVDESQPYPRRYLAWYPAAKAAAERLVLTANDSSLATVALRPHLIFGPGDPHLLPRVVDRARRGRLAQVGRGDNLVDVTYVDNAARAHLAAVDRLSPGAACAGRPYFITQGEPLRLWNWLNRVLEAVGAPTVKRRIGYHAAYAMGICCERLFFPFFRGGELPMTRFLAVQLGKSHYFRIDAARRDLAYEVQTTTDEGLSATLPYLRGLV